MKTGLSTPPKTVPLERTSKTPKTSIRQEGKSIGMEKYLNTRLNTPPYPDPHHPFTEPTVPEVGPTPNLPKVGVPGGRPPSTPPPYPDQPSLR
eukprot:4883532-Amphidinium_carterae.1